MVWTDPGSLSPASVARPTAGGNTPWRHLPYCSSDGERAGAAQIGKWRRPAWVLTHWTWVKSSIEWGPARPQPLSLTPPWAAALRQRSSGR